MYNYSLAAPTSGACVLRIGTREKECRPNLTRSSTSTHAQTLHTHGTRTTHTLVRAHKASWKFSTPQKEIELESALAARATPLSIPLPSLSPHQKARPRSLMHTNTRTLGEHVTLLYKDWLPPLPGQIVRRSLWPVTKPPTTLATGA